MSHKIAIELLKSCCQLLDLIVFFFLNFKFKHYCLTPFVYKVRAEFRYSRLQRIFASTVICVSEKKKTYLYLLRQNNYVLLLNNLIFFKVTKTRHYVWQSQIFLYFSVSNYLM